MVWYSMISVGTYLLIAVFSNIHRDIEKPHQSSLKLSAGTTGNRHGILSIVQNKSPISKL